MDMSFENIVTGAIVIIVVLVSALIMYQFYPDVKDQIFNIANDVFNVKENADQAKIEEQALKNAKDLVGNIKNMFETCKYDFNCICPFKMDTGQIGENKVLLMQNEKNIEIIIFDKSSAVVGGETIENKELYLAETDKSSMISNIKFMSDSSGEISFLIDDKTVGSGSWLKFINFNGQMRLAPIYPNTLYNFLTGSKMDYLKNLKDCDAAIGEDSAKKEVTKIIELYDGCISNSKCEEYTVSLPEKYILSHTEINGFHLYYKVLENEILLDEAAYKSDYYIKCGTDKSIISLRKDTKLVFGDKCFSVSGEKIDIPVSNMITISGKVIDEEGRAVENANVEFFNGDCKLFNDEEAYTKTKDQIVSWLTRWYYKGKFEIEVPEGEYCVTAMNLTLGRIYKKFIFSNANANEELIIDYNTWDKFSDRIENEGKFNADIPSNIYINKPGTIAYTNEVKYSPLVRQYAQSTNVNYLLAKAIIQQESDKRQWGADSLSYTGAAGLMQIMPDTARGLGINVPDYAECNSRKTSTLCEGCKNDKCRNKCTACCLDTPDNGCDKANDERFNAEENIKGGIKLIRQLMDNPNAKENGQINFKYVIAAYNGGPAAIKDSNTCPGKKVYLCTALPKYYEPGRYSQTAEYVDKVCAYWNMAVGLEPCG